MTLLTNNIHMENDPTVWAINPKGRTVALPPELWEDPNRKEIGRKFQYGWRLANDEEIAAELQLTIDANKKIADSKIVKTLIINKEAIPADIAEKVKLSYAELKALAKKRGIKSFGKKKEVLESELGI